jgi:hypothetical protein
MFVAKRPPHPISAASAARNAEPRSKFIPLLLQSFSAQRRQYNRFLGGSYRGKGDALLGTSNVLMG